MKVNVLTLIAGASTCLFSFAMTGCGGGGSSQNSVGSSGIQGHAQIVSHSGSSFPGAPAPTPQPYSGTTVEVETSVGGSVLTQVKTDNKGNFSVSLTPGIYLVVPSLTAQEQKSGITSQNQTVVVTGGQYAAVTVSYSQSLP